MTVADLLRELADLAERTHQPSALQPASDPDVGGWCNGEHALQFHMPILPTAGSLTVDLDFLRAALDGLRSAGRRAIFRPRYNKDSGGIDADLDTVRLHIEQLGPVLHEFADVLYVSQLGFFGAWGEWHSSQTYGGIPALNVRTAAIGSALEHWPGYIAVRRPMWHEEFSTQDMSELHRLTVYDDCVGCSASDGGTWPSAEQDQWRDYIGKLPRVGGELSQMSSTPDSLKGFAATMAICERMRVRYVNSRWNAAVWAGWSLDEMRLFTERMGRGWVA